MDIGLIGIAAIFGLSALGSGLGARVAGLSAIGAWKRNYMANKPASFLLVAFAGAPLTQTIYGFLLMNQMRASSADPLLLAVIGIISGAAIAMSAVAQGKASASSCDAYGETGKGFGQYITVVGLCETVALFVMVFTFIAVG